MTPPDRTTRRIVIFLFLLTSAALAGYATNSLSAGGAVLFGLWYLGGIVDHRRPLE